MENPAVASFNPSLPVYCARLPPLSQTATVPRRCRDLASCSSALLLTGRRKLSRAMARGAATSFSSQNFKRISALLVFSFPETELRPSFALRLDATRSFSELRGLKIIARKTFHISKRKSVESFQYSSVNFTHVKRLVFFHLAGTYENHLKVILCAFSRFFCCRWKATCVFLQQPQETRNNSSPPGRTFLFTRCRRCFWGGPANFGGRLFCRSWKSRTGRL